MEGEKGWNIEFKNAGQCNWSNYVNRRERERERVEGVLGGGERGKEWGGVREEKEEKSEGQLNREKEREFISCRSEFSQAAPGWSASKFIS